MTPTLARFIQLARHRILGTELSKDVAADVQHADAIDAFKQFLARKIDLNIRLELFSEPQWQWSLDGPSVTQS
jgi:hypothetical protein